MYLLSLISSLSPEARCFILSCLILLTVFRFEVFKMLSDMFFEPFFLVVETDFFPEPFRIVMSKTLVYAFKTEYCKVGFLLITIFIL